MGNGTVLLNDPVEEVGTFLQFERPGEIICAWTAAEVSGAVRAAEAALGRGFHLAGWLSYELGDALSTLALRPAPNPLGYPLLWLGVYERVDRVRRAELHASGRAYAGRLRYGWDRQRYIERCRRVQEYIRAGDIYQANLSFRSRFTFVGDSLALYLSLWDAAQARHAGYVDAGCCQILSLSPELFFQVSKSRLITVRPMKGTASRGTDSDSDQRARQALRSSAKDRAENVMIVDLMRSDLGRIADTGSVEVGELFELQTLPTLHTLVSTVSAALKPGTGLGSILEALFPSGSVTGAPKRRAMQIIRELETEPRGVYCGAVGHLTPAGEASFNVAIRTLILQDGEGTLGTGGAVVADSAPTAEYEECLLKARWFESVREPLGLIETLRWEPSQQGAFHQLERHLERMAKSAAVLTLRFERDTALSALNAAVTGCICPQRVRLELSESGVFVCTTAALEAPPAHWRFVIASRRVHSRDLLLRHKTTWRRLYDAEWARGRTLAKADEVLFLNERGELTEGSRSNIFLRRSGRLLTPASSCGLLNGVLRTRLLEQRECEEAVLTLQDLRAAEEILLGNSLRGLIPARAAIRGDSSAGP